MPTLVFLAVVAIVLFPGFIWLLSALNLRLKTTCLVLRLSRLERRIERHGGVAECAPELLLKALSLVARRQAYLPPGKHGRLRQRYSLIQQNLEI